ncbi:MAG: L,D-transpeptidase family protein [Geminicoccaceae bacterium]|nr:L,D-transpeptidase family protein [Geminicoccaceae bacterium]
MPPRRALLVGLAGSALAYASAARDGSGPTGDLLGSLRWHLTEETDTLLDIAVANDVGILAISAANPGVDPWVPGADRLILLPTAHILPEGPREGILINKAELGLYWFPKGRPVRRHAIGVGRDGYDTPVGETRVVRKQKDPTWYPTPRTPPRAIRCPRGCRPAPTIRSAIAP